MTDLAVERPQEAPDIDVDSADDPGRCPDCDYVVSANLPSPLRRGQLGRHRHRAHGTAWSPVGQHGKKQPTGRPRGRPPGSSKATSSAARPPAAGSRPAPARARRSTADLLGPLWGLASGFVPGRAGGIMGWEAPAAGPILDKAAAGTVVDRLVLQRIARSEDKWGDVIGLIGLPMIGMAMDMNPKGVKDNALLRGMAQTAIVRMIDATLDAEIEQRRQLAALDAKARQAGMEGVEAAVARVMAAIFGEDEVAPGPAEPVTPLVPVG